MSRTLFKKNLNRVHRTPAEPAASATAERRTVLRERLLAAAREAIRAGGLQNLKARDLAASAGCAVGAIYNVFDDLDELILRVGADTLARLEQALTGATAQAPGADPADDLARLARAYLDFARTHKLLWRALFEHRLSGARPVPSWFLEDQSRLFGLLDAPLAQLLPNEPPAARALMARTLFSAVHGVVSLGLEEKLAPMPAQTLDDQLDALVRAFAAGLSPRA
jgi:AcrR family transcriptional regulator